jgi:hypothetical protein
VLWSGLNRGVELNLSLDNLTNRDYYETQNWFESRVSPTAAAVERIHATPGFPLTVVVGVPFRLAASDRGSYSAKPCCLRW